MHIQSIENERDYREALKEIDGLMDARQNTPEGNRLDVLVKLVEAWEERHWPLERRRRGIWKPGASAKRVAPG